MNKNIDLQVVEDFGNEWSRFDQSGLTEEDKIAMFNSYFEIFPWDKLPKDATGFDLGCGSGRWAILVAPRVGILHCIDPSLSALEVAQKKLVDHSNCQFHQASVDSIPLDDQSCDFGYTLGVLHHVPDTKLGIKSCVNKLKKGSPFLIYLYYAFDNKPVWYKILWKISDIGRQLISRLPFFFKYVMSQVIALIVYWPIARLDILLEKLGFNVDNLPLSYYKNRSFYVMKTDALDRFGTKLEKRFSKKEIYEMLEQAGLENISFSNHAPYWCAVGYKR
jgi:ubiquinone/menaquinone biosynthesis C-methylase UbiE